MLIYRPKGRRREAEKSLLEPKSLRMMMLIMMMSKADMGLLLIHPPKQKPPQHSTQSHPFPKEHAVEGTYSTYGY